MKNEYIRCKMCNRSIYVGDDEKYQEEISSCECCGKDLCQDCINWIDEMIVCSRCYDENE